MNLIGLKMLSEERGSILFTYVTWNAEKSALQTNSPPEKSPPLPLSRKSFHRGKVPPGKVPPGKVPPRKSANLGDNVDGKGIHNTVEFR